jgi:hypothetical protein
MKPPASSGRNLAANYSERLPIWYGIQNESIRSQCLCFLEVCYVFLAIYLGWVEFKPMHR